MTLRLLALAALAIASPCAGQASDTPGSADPTPLWRVDTSKLDEDVARLEGCFATADDLDERSEEACIGLVDDACTVEIGEDAAVTTGGARRCRWRELAAWEEVLDAVVAALNGELSGGELETFEAAQSAWTDFLVANVRARSARYEGGSSQGLLAAQVRSEMVAARAVELRAYRRWRDP